MNHWKQSLNKAQGARSVRPSSAVAALPPLDRVDQYTMEPQFDIPRKRANNWLALLHSVRCLWSAWV